MQIGSRVVVKTDCYMPVVLAGRKGIIIEEHAPDSQAAMLSGISNFVVRFDEWIDLGTSRIKECKVPGNALMLESEGI